jgi:hypothetical protein
MTAPSAEVLVDSLSRKGLILLHLVGRHDVEKEGEEPIERSVHLYPASKRGGSSEGAGEEQIALHGTNLGNRGRRCIHLYDF